MNRVPRVMFAFICALVMSAGVQAQESEFQGKIGETLEDSEQYWPPPVTPCSAIRTSQACQQEIPPSPMSLLLGRSNLGITSSMLSSIGGTR